MRCAEAWALLHDLDAGRPPAGDDAEALAALGLATRAAAPTGSAGVADLREDLRSVQAQADEARAALAGAGPAEVAAAKQAIAALVARERDLRAAILELAELPASAECEWVLTFRGRDLVGELEPRLARVGGDEVTEFLREMNELRGLLTTQASRAKALLAELSPGLPAIDEIDLRCAVVGLAASPREPRELVARFTAALGRFPTVPTSRRVLLAEAAATGPGSADDLDAFARSVRARIPDPADGTAAAAIAWSDGASAAETIERGLAIAAALGPGELAPAVLLAEAGRADRADRFRDAVAAVAGAERDAAAARWAAALLCLAPCEPAAALRRFEAVRAWLARFGAEGLSGPAAMLVLLDAEAPELLDDLRLASAAVREHALSISAIETLALGVKLLLQVAMVPHARLPGFSSGGTTAALPVGRLGAPFRQATIATYHAATVHRRVVHHDASHPLHAHTVYG
jgi:hypothetical protein